MDRRTFTIHLRRPHDKVPWGFRLQGGANFAAPLSVQVVQPDSIAAQAGLLPGDGVLKINQKNADLLEHDEAKEEILKSGNEVVFFVQRGAVTTWAPTVIGKELQTTHTFVPPADDGELLPSLSRISLAANKPTESQSVGSSYNRVPKPFVGSSSVIAPDDRRSQQPAAAVASPSTASHSSLPPAPATVAPAQFKVVLAVPASSQTPVASTILAPPVRNIIIEDVDDPLPPPPPPLNAGALPLHEVGAKAAAAAAQRAARLVSDRSLSPAQPSNGSKAAGRSVSPSNLDFSDSGGQAQRSLSPSRLGIANGQTERPVSPYRPVSHSRSGSSELLQQHTTTSLPRDLQAGDISTSQQQQKSAVLLALQQEEDFKKKAAAAPATEGTAHSRSEDEPPLYKGSAVKSRIFRMLEQEIERGVEVKSVFSQPSATSASVPGFKSVSHPQAKWAAGQSDNGGAAVGHDPADVPHCFACGGIISGVFARIKGRPIHSECLRCHRCHQSLKNIGYFLVNDNIYCEQHAREATRPPGDGYTSHTVEVSSNTE